MLFDRGAGGVVALDQRIPSFDRNTLSDKVYDFIRSGIVNGQFQPGTRLKETDLAEMLGVSTTPVREALRQLTSAGLVERRRYQGTYVPDVDVSVIQHIYEVRMALEELATELACARMDKSDFAMLRAVLHEHEEAFRQEDLRALLDTDMELHRVVLQASENEFLLHTYEELGMRIQMLRQLDTSATRRAESLDGHRALVAALEARDVATAKRIAREHVIRGKEYVVSVAQQLLEKQRTEMERKN
jgi:DNA-binding GntR family transcriptional regulator